MLLKINLVRHPCQDHNIETYKRSRPLSYDPAITFLYFYFQSFWDEPRFGFRTFWSRKIRVKLEEDSWPKVSLFTRLSRDRLQSGSICNSLQTNETRHIPNLVRKHRIQYQEYIFILYPNASNSIIFNFGTISKWRHANLTQNFSPPSIKQR